MTSDGKIVVARGSDGVVERVVADEKSLGFKPRSISLLDDGETLYTMPETEDTCTPVIRISLSSSERTTIVDRVAGWDVSADGRWLGFTNKDCKDQNTVVIRDLKSGVERSWSILKKERNDFSAVEGVQFLSDPRFVYYYQCGADSCGPRLLDTKRDTDLGEQRVSLAARDPKTGQDIGVGSSTIRGARGTFVFTVQYPDVGGEETYPILEADWRSGRLTATLAVFPPNPADPPDEPEDPYTQSYHTHRIAALDFDPSGNHMLFVHDDVLYRWLGGRITRIRAGFDRAEW